MLAQGSPVKPRSRSPRLMSVRALAPGCCEGLKRWALVDSHHGPAAFQEPRRRGPLDELRELVLVAEDDLEPARPYPHLATRHTRGGDPGALCKQRIDGRRRPRASTRSRRLRCPP